MSSIHSKYSFTGVVILCMCNDHTHCIGRRFYSWSKFKLTFWLELSIRWLFKKFDDFLWTFFIIYNIIYYEIAQVIANITYYYDSYIAL